MYHWDALVMYHWDVVACFIWELFGTLWRRTDGKSLLPPSETLSRRSNKTSWRRTSWRLGNVPPRRCCVFHLRCACDVTRTYRETSLRHRYDVLLPWGWKPMYIFLKLLYKRSYQFLLLQDTQHLGQYNKKEDQNTVFCQI